MNIKDLELKSFLKDGEDYISGDEMLKRAGNAVTDYKELLKHQDKFPKEWRGYYLVFPKWLGDSRDRYVPCFEWGGKSRSWVLSFHWVGLSFSRNDRFVCPRESLEPGSLGASGSLETLPLELIINGVTYVRK